MYAIVSLQVREPDNLFIVFFHPTCWGRQSSWILLTKRGCKLDVSPSTTMVFPETRTRINARGKSPELSRVSLMAEIWKNSRVDLVILGGTAKSEIFSFKLFKLRFLFDIARSKSFWLASKLLHVLLVPDVKHGCVVLVEKTGSR